MPFTQASGSGVGMEPIEWNDCVGNLSDNFHEIAGLLDLLTEWLDIRIAKPMLLFCIRKGF